MSAAGSAPPGRPETRHVLLLLLLAGIWSSSFLLIKIAVASVPPVTLAAGRVLIAAAVLVVFAAREGHRLPRDPRLYATFVVIGLLGNAFPFVLIHWGELTIDSALAAILMGIMPIATAVLAHFAAGEVLNGTRLAGVALGFAGLLALVGQDALAGLGAHFRAELAVLGGALCYALTTVLVRRSVTAPGPVMAAGALTAASVLMVPLALVLEQPWQLAPGAGALAAGATLGIVHTALAALLYFHLIKHLGATYFSQVNNVIPLLGVLWGWTILAEQPPLRALLALALIVSGMLLLTRARTAPG